MSKLLHIRCSPRDESVSLKLAKAFIETWCELHPNAEREELNLFTAELPPFEAPHARAKYAVLGGEEPRNEAERAWQPVVQLAEHFKSADLYVFSVPMWNFSIPYRLKHYIDLLVQPALTFSYDPERGYEGLVSGPAVLCLARGSNYAQGSAYAPADYQRPYLQRILSLIGIDEIHDITAEGAMASPPLGRLESEARRLAEKLDLPTVEAD